MTGPLGPTVSAVVCAYTEERWDDTLAAVESLSGQSRPPEEILLVVDHNAGLSDRARGWFASRPHLRVVDNELTRGLAGARNTALREVAGDVVVFLDDDAVARPDWIATVLPHYDAPNVVAVGGRAEPRWPAGAPPACLPSELHWVVGCSYAGQHAPERAGPVRNLMGCAMSLRWQAVDAVHGFSESLGRVGTTPLGGEETELCIRLRQARPSSVVLLDPLAVVDHRVTRVRTTWTYLVRRCWSEGVSKALLTRSVGRGDGLAAERGYTRSVVPTAWWRELRTAAAAAARGRVPTARRALLASVALPLAVLAAGAGYVRGRIASRPREATLLPGALANRRLAAGLLALCGVLACVLAASGSTRGLPGQARAVATTAFLLLGPGWAVAGFLRRASPALLWSVAVAVGSAIGAMAAAAMLLLNQWHPVAALDVLVVLCLPALLRHTVMTR